MKKMFGLLFILLLSACGYETDSVSFNSETPNLDCFVCKNALHGIILTEENSCNGALELWTSTQKLICVSSCAKECFNSICSSLPIDDSCRVCLMNSSSKEIYLDCEMVGSQ